MLLLCYSLKGKQILDSLIQEVQLSSNQSSMVSLTSSNSSLNSRDFENNSRCGNCGGNTTEKLENQVQNLNIDF